MVEGDGPTESGRSMTAVGSIWRRLAPRSDWSDEDNRAMLAELFPEADDAADFVWRFLTLMVLSTLIAALGLIANSAAVVIGAMLVAPLMAPILGVAVSLVLGDPRRLAKAVALIAAGVVVAIGAAYVVSAMAPPTLSANDLTGELLARTEPSLLDLGVAVAAGLAAGFVLTHPKAGSSLPGVAIAVALVPPLATVGVALQLGADDEARGALLLFATNLLAIIMAAMLVALASGLATSRRGARSGLLITGLMLVLVAVPLTVHTVEVVEDRSFTRQAVRSVEAWDPNSEILELDADVGAGGRGSVSVLMTTSFEPEPAWRLAEILHSDADREVTVEVQYVVETADEAVAG